MPGWEETENEIRFRIKDPDAFTPGTFFVKDLQEKPRNYAVFGQLKGDNVSSMQALRFPKEDWKLEEAQKWYEEHKAEIEKSEQELKIASAKMAEYFKEHPVQFLTWEDCLGMQKAEWTTEFVNNLPDSSFAFIEPGGEKDKEGYTTPRSTRHFPYKDKNGKVDLPHLRNALARMSQSPFGDKAKQALEDAAKEAKIGEFTEAKKSIAEVEPDFFEKSGLIIQAFSFDDKEFTEKSVREWLVSKNFDISTLKKTAGKWSVEIKPEANFMDGSLRDLILRDGIKATVGLLKKDIVNKKVPNRFALKAEDLNQLEDLDIVEVTLTRAPAVGKMAEFRIIKSAELPSENFSLCVPIIKINEEKKQVGAYVIVPNLPDWQGDIASPIEVENAAHKFMRNLAFKSARGTGTGLEHADFNGIGYPAESFIDTTGIHGVPGGWWLSTQVCDNDVWDKIKKGEIIGYSLGGTGKRKKQSLNLSIPVAKNEELADTILARFVKFFGFKQSEPKQDEIIKQFVSKEQKMPDIELMKKFDLKPSEIEFYEKQGVDMKKAVESMETLLKALNISLSNSGIGYTTLKIMDVIRGGEFGMWPTPQVAWNPNNLVGKAIIPIAQPQPQMPDDKTKPNGTVPVEAACATDAKKNEEMVKTIEALVKSNEELLKRIETLESSRGIRKSTDAIPPDDPSRIPQTQRSGFDAGDCYDISLSKSREILKSQGVNISRFNRA